MDQKAALLDDSKRRKVSNCLDNDALFSIVGPLIKEGMTAKTCRRIVSVYEEEHFSYFSLFKPSFERDGKTWIENARQDIKTYGQAELRHYYENFMQSARSFQGMLLLCMS